MDYIILNFLKIRFESSIFGLFNSYNKLDKYKAEKGMEVASLEQVNTIKLDYLIVQAEGNIVSDMDGEKVMLSIKNGKYYNLGEVGGFIWECIEQPKSIANIIEELKEEYHVTAEQCEKDIIPFIEMLKEEGLIEIKG